MTRFGLCCISLNLQDHGVGFKTTNVTYHLAQPKNKREASLMAIVAHNLRTTLATIKYCHMQGWTYRMSSSLFPLLNYEPANLSWEKALKYSEVSQAIEAIKDYLVLSELRVSLHPDQFVVLASDNPEVRSRSISEMENHAMFMDLIGVEQSFRYPINIHMNNYRPGALERFGDSFSKLSKSVTSRLVLENEDKLNSWNVEQLHRHIYSTYGMPITYDCLHHRCNSGTLNATEAVQLCISTWGDYRPLFHISDSSPESDNPRAHALYPVGIPIEYFELDGVDLEVEFKAKDRAIELLENYYPVRA